MRRLTMPPLWLLVLVIALPQLSETVYTPALPSVAFAFGVGHALVEYTLTIYLLGFALGTLFWGKLSDKFGRKPSLLAGLFLYTLGCLGCFYSTTFLSFMASRFIQAFGGSTGSVLGQVICRDAFLGSQRGKVFSVIGSALAFSPAVGPIIGGFIAQSFAWSSIFLVLVFFALLLIGALVFYLPETYTPLPFSYKTILYTASKMFKDPVVLASALLVGACNGIIFSYFAEGPFYLITLLGMSPFLYGLSFVLFALAGMIGGYSSKKAHERAISSYSIMQSGALVVMSGSLLLLLSSMIFSIFSLQAMYGIVFTLISMAMIMGGISSIIPNVLSCALEGYESSLGTASSLFGFFYYCLISFFTLIMGLIHSHTLFSMPIYFIVLASLIVLVVHYLKKQSIK